MKSYVLVSNMKSVCSWQELQATAVNDFFILPIVLVKIINCMSS